MRYQTEAYLINIILIICRKVSKPLAVRRVFVVWTNPLFHESTRLLLEHPDVDLVGAAQNPTMVHEEILKLRPDTILFERTSQPIPEYLIRLMGMDAWDMRLIGLSLEDNKVSLYHREQQAVVEAGDLLQYVLG
ncbi:MAG TPA: hypothetical protein VN364_06855 [Bellilinea sp.]|nr:hypothetical protein [Bellilinea sp.]